MTKLRSAVCPSCGTTVTVTYWPYNVPLYTLHLVAHSTRECRQSLRPVVDDSGAVSRRTP
jgi:C4-type Zn-finger protein